MSIRSHTAVVAGAPPQIEVRNAAGLVSVTAVEGAADIQVEVEALDEAAEQWLDRVEIDVRDAEPEAGDSPLRLRVAVPERRLFRSPSFAVRITTPAGTAARIAVASAHTQLTGRFGTLELTGASADLDAEHGTDVHVRTASGVTRIGTVEGQGSLSSASGDVHVGRAGGPLKIRTASGKAAIDTCSGTVTVHTASGDVRVGAATGGAVEVKTASGDVTVGVAPGLRVWLDLSSVSGRMQSGLADDGAAGEGPAQLSLTLRSVSGDLRVRTASAAPAT
jgi:Putative adhesin